MIAVALLVVWAAIAAVGIVFLQSLIREYKNTRRPRSPVPVGAVIFVAALAVTVRCAHEVGGLAGVVTVVHEARDIEHHLAEIRRLRR